MTRRIKRDPKKQELIRQLVSEYGVESIADIQNALKNLLGGTIEEQAKNNLDIVADKWESKYPKLMSSWYSEYDAITPIFKFSVKVRTVIYTTNAVESVNSRLRSMNKKRSVFPNKVSLEKALYLAVERIVKKWTGAIKR
ncbi:transposase [Gemella haemolysans]|uniref:transposase n=1 Tax=Gemella haemolysans TaxID=1379 RepID=UPI0019583AAD|nr:transposase [Gemella haemolysans]VTX77683.1 Transposase, Mutator family [Gemella haemolysans]